MRYLTILTLVLISIPVLADDPPTKAPPDAVKTKDHAELSRLIHKMVVKEIPKEFEDRSGWGQTVPLTEKLRFPNLPRAKVKIGDKEEYPHGLWKKFRVRVDDPAKDVTIQVREFSRVDSKTIRLALDSEAALIGEGEVQHWQKGLPLGRVSGQADAVLALSMSFDVGVTLSTKKFPPELIVEPKLTELQIDLKEFNLRRVGNDKILELEGESAKNLGNDMKDTLKSLIKALEPEIKSRANAAIEKSLKEGKGNISPAALLKLTPAAKPKEKEAEDKSPPK